MMGTRKRSRRRRKRSKSQRQSRRKMVLQIKPCSRCHREKPILAFHQDGSQKDGRRSECKACRAIWRSEGDKKYSQSKKGRKVSRQKRRRQTARSRLMIDRWIGDRNCYICDQIAILGDHLDPRTKNPNYRGLSDIYNEEEFQREAEKCLPACRLCNSTKGSYDKLVLAGEAEPDIETIRNYIFEKVGEGQQY